MSIGTTVFLLGLVAIYYAYGLTTLLVIVGCLIVLAFWLEGRRPVPIPPEMFGDPVAEPPDEPPLLPSPVERRFIDQQRLYAAITNRPGGTFPAASDRAGSAVRPPPAGHRW